MAKLAPGISRNPSGRKPGSTSRLSRELAQVVKAGGKDKQIAEKLVEMAVAGDIQAAKLVFDRLEGRVKTTKELAMLRLSQFNCRI